uniref:Arc/MetJ-type ribon-helix-helix transcriptional regulator n=1 Tax=Methanococcus maripaludis (strain C6 / ATCC BAA-1332) TaxID=444158 RepID=A9A7U9_METM6
MARIPKLTQPRPYLFNLEETDIRKLDSLRTTTGREVSRSAYIRSVIRQTFDKISVISENEQLTQKLQKITEENKTLKETLSKEVEEKEALSKRIEEYESYLKSGNDEIESYVQNARWLFTWILKDWDSSDKNSREIARPAILKHISRIKKVLNSRNFEIECINEVSEKIEG